MQFSIKLMRIWGRRYLNVLFLALYFRHANSDSPSLSIKVDQSKVS
jgi:hypothetical protein